MIQMQPNARYVILGEDRAHASLTELVRYHQSVGIQPFMEILSIPCGQVNAKDLQPKKGMGHGLCPEQTEPLRQHLFFVFPLRVSHSGQTAWSLLHAPGSATSWALRSPGVGERLWQVDDIPLTPPRMSAVGTAGYSFSLYCLGHVEGLQAAAQSVLPSLRKVVRVWIMKIWSASRQVRQQPRMRPLQRSSPAPPDQPPADLLCGWEQLLFSNKCGSGGPRRAKTSRAWTRIAQNEAQARREAANEPALASTPPYAWRCGKYSR